MFSLPFEITATNHLLIELRINDYPSIFLVDTGASASCIDLSMVEILQLNTSEFNYQMSSANADIEQPILTESILMQSGDFKHRTTLIAIDMSTINASLHPMHIGPVNGILGTDVLMELGAIIDFNQKKLFFGL